MGSQPVFSRCRGGCGRLCSSGRRFFAEDLSQGVLRARADFVRAAADVDDRACFQLGVQAVGVVDEALLRVFAAFAAAVGAVQPGKDAVFPLFFEAGGVDAVVFGSRSP